MMRHISIVRRVRKIVFAAMLTGAISLLALPGVCQAAPLPTAPTWGTPDGASAVVTSSTAIDPSTVLPGATVNYTFKARFHYDHWAAATTSGTPTTGTSPFFRPTFTVWEDPAAPFTAPPTINDIQYLNDAGATVSGPNGVMHPASVTSVTKTVGGVSIKGYKFLLNYYEFDGSSSPDGQSAGWRGSGGDIPQDTTIQLVRSGVVAPATAAGTILKAESEGYTMIAPISDWTNLNSTTTIAGNCDVTFKVGATYNGTNDYGQWLQKIMYSDNMSTVGLTHTVTEVTPPTLVITPAAASPVPLVADATVTNNPTYSTSVPGYVPAEDNITVGNNTPATAYPFLVKWSFPFNSSPTVYSGTDWVSAGTKVEITRVVNITNCGNNDKFDSGMIVFSGRYAKPTVASSADTTEVLGVTYKLGDRVWDDTNGNGIQDAGEPGVADVGVDLTKPDGSVVHTTTDSQGNYLFTGLPNGTYSVKFTPPSGRKFTTALSGTDTTADSNPDATSGTVSVTIKGADDLTIDAGLVNLPAPEVVPPPEVVSPPESPKQDLPTKLAETGHNGDANVALIVGIVSVAAAFMLRHRRQK